MHTQLCTHIRESRWAHTHTRTTQHAHTHTRTTHAQDKTRTHMRKWRWAHTSVWLWAYGDELAYRLWTSLHVSSSGCIIHIYITYIFKLHVSSQSLNCRSDPRIVALWPCTRRYVCACNVCAWNVCVYVTYLIYTYIYLIYIYMYIHEYTIHLCIVYVTYTLMTHCVRAYTYLCIYIRYIYKSYMLHTHTHCMYVRNPRFVALRPCTRQNMYT